MTTLQFSRAPMPPLDMALQTQLSNKFAGFIKSMPICHSHTVREPGVDGLGQIEQLHSHADPNITSNLNNFPAPYSSFFYRSKFIRNTFVLSRKGSDCFGHLPKCRCLRECFKIHILWHDERNDDVSEFLFFISSECTPSRLNDVDA